MKKSKVYLIIQTVVCIALVALMVVGALSIYREGSARKAQNPLESIYTPENVAGKFAPIAPLFFAALGLLVAGLVLGIEDEAAQKPVNDAALNRDLTVGRVCQPSDAMRREAAVQRRLDWIGWGAFALCMIPVALFLINPDHFPGDDPEVMFYGLMQVFLPWIAVGLGALAVTAVLKEKSVLRQTEAAKAQLKAERDAGMTPPVAPPARVKQPNALRAALLVAAVALIIAGIFNSSAQDVLYKAITICTECVGLG